MNNITWGLPGTINVSKATTLDNEQTTGTMNTPLDTMNTLLDTMNTPLEQ